MHARPRIYESAPTLTPSITDDLWWPDFESHPSYNDDDDDSLRFPIFHATTKLFDHLPMFMITIHQSSFLKHFFGETFPA